MAHCLTRILAWHSNFVHACCGLVNLFKQNPKKQYIGVPGHDSFHFANTRPTHDMVRAGSLRMFVMDSQFGGYFESYVPHVI